MLNVVNRFMIRDLYRQGVSISKIARRTGHDRKTIRHIIQAPLMPMPASSEQRRHRSHKIDPYISHIDVEARMKLGVLNARKLYSEIRAQGYPGKETQVRDYVHARPPKYAGSGYSGLRLLPSTLPTVRFETEPGPGEQAQVDWGSFGFMNCDGRNLRWPQSPPVRLRYDTWLVKSHVPGVHSISRYRLVAALSPTCLRILRRRSSPDIARQPQECCVEPGAEWC
jgi:hypothetical protein